MKKKEKNGFVDNGITNPNDKGYKYLLSKEKYFLELLETFVAEGWVSQIDAQSVTRIDTSYILQDFSEREADLVYRLKIKEQEVIFYLLLELQSTVDFQMPYRLLRYMIEIWRDLLKNTDANEAARKEFKLPLIVPLVLYNGSNSWTVERQYKDTLAGVELFEEYAVNFKYILLDVNRYKEDALKQLPNLIKAVFLLDQKSTPEELFRRLKELTQFLETLAMDDLSYFKVWVQNIAARSVPQYSEEIEKIIAGAKPGEVAQMVYNFEITMREALLEGIEKGKLEGIEKGKLEGIEKGKIQGKLEDAEKMLDKGINEDLIMEITGLTPEQITQLKEGVSKEVQ